MGILKRTYNVHLALGIRAGSPEEAKEIAETILKVAHDGMTIVEPRMLKKWKDVKLSNDITPQGKQK